MKNIIFIALIGLTLGSCTVSRNSMREGNYQLWLHHEDLKYSQQLTGTATQTKVAFVDWKRLFGKQDWNYGNFGAMPQGPISNSSSGSLNVGVNSVSNNGLNTAQNIVATTLNGVVGINNFNRVEQMAMFDLIAKNPGYDLILFPQFVSKRKWFVVGSKTEVTCVAKLASLKDTRP